jgi:uncharacterized protein involved in response to NO
MKNIVPYQLFFPLGFLNAVLAVGIWFAQDLGWFQTPALLIHSKLIAGGFLWSFVVGFLMTAIPRMTGCSSASKIELVAAFAIVLLMMFSSWNIDARPFYAGSITLIVFLLVYGGRRILKSTKSVPVFFSHVGLAMVLALLGSWFHFQGDSFMGIHLYQVGAILLLVLGIGTRFFSFLSGLPSVFENTKTRWMIGAFHTCGLLVAVFLFLAGKGFSFAYLALAGLGVFYLFGIWQVQRPSDRRSALKYGARIVSAMIPLSFFMTWLQPQMFVTWFHLLFIGCFGVITFSVATRVTLAHGSYSTDIEIRSKSLWWVLTCLVCGLSSRLLYGFSDGMWRKSFLHLAATFWLLAVIIWCGAFLLKVFKPGPQSKPSC